MNDEFYIGWEAKSGKGIGAHTKRVVGALLLLALLGAVGLAAAQRMIGASVFEWGTLKTVSGVLEMKPVPHLLVARPRTDAGSNEFSAYYLVAKWKYGLDPKALEPFDGHPVAVKGTLIYREHQVMIETAPEWITASAKSAPAALPQPSSLGTHTLVGEIVDSKCFLGVMNPGQLTPHRACAIRCISGGIPPVLLVRQAEGPPLYFLLVSAEGKPVNQQVLDLVAEPVEIRGEIIRQGELLTLRADPATYRRAAK